MIVMAAASRSAWGSVRTCTMSTRSRVGGGRDRACGGPARRRRGRSVDAADRDRPRVARLQPAHGGARRCRRDRWLRTFAALSTNLNSSSPGALDRRARRCPARATRRRSPPVANSGSVISVTTDVPPVAVSTLPTSPAPLITGSPRCTPSLVPLLIVKRWYQLLEERIVTRARRPARTGPSRRSCRSR